MNNEKMQLKGQLAEARQRLREKDIEAKGLILLLRSLLNPWEEDLTKIRGDEAFAAAKRLHQLLCDIKEISPRVSAMEDALNG